jgi:3-hydroxy-9,10-secoandrosta-1,3,5(10)-triene-9,17-dione monooxygenase reductase component
MGLLKLTSESSLDLERGSVVVAIPVHNGYDHVVESVAAALRHTAVDVPICIINDGSSDERIELFIEELGGSSDLEHRLYYLSHHAKRGFVESCNEAFDLFAPADVVLLNSDCVVSEGWLERMRSAAASDARVATVSVMANSATMISVPERNTPTDGLPAALTLDEAARAVGENALGSRPEIPTAIGHCVLIRRSALELVGGFDPIFSPGYGEEVDFAQRCLIVGLKHVMADTLMSIKDAMSCFTTGVTVVTTRFNGQDWGMTCNSFNTVSLEPALVLWSVRKESQSREAFVQSGGYLVNVLEKSQKNLALQYAQGTQAERFAGQTLVRSAQDYVRLPQSLAWFECKLSQVVSAGDHDILIGEVVDFGLQPGQGLAYAQRSFGSLAALV